MRSKKKVILATSISVLACILVVFIIAGIKEYSIYREYSKIEEIHTNKPIENPDDYGLDYDNIMFYSYLLSRDIEYAYCIFYFDDGSVVSGKADEEQLSEFMDAVRYGDETAFWSSMDYTYKGNIGGKRLYNLIRLNEKINFDAEYYSTWEEFDKMYDGYIDEERPPFTEECWLGADKSPYLSFWKVEKGGGEFFFWYEESDGIIYYLFDKNAEELVYSTIDSSFFDEWMSECWGGGWKDTFKIYRSKDDFVVPKW